MHENHIGYSAVSVPPFAPELFEKYVQTCVQAAARLAYYAAIDNCHSGRLTKKFLTAAQAGGYLVSNIGQSTASGHAPIFAEVVADSVEARLQQWSRIKAVEADDRLCYLHKSRRAYEQLNSLAQFGGIRID